MEREHEELECLKDFQQEQFEFLITGYNQTQRTVLAH